MGLQEICITSLRLKTVQLKQKALSLRVFETSIQNLVFCGCRLNIKTVYGQFSYQLLSSSDVFWVGSRCASTSFMSHSVSSESALYTTHELLIRHSVTLTLLHARCRAVLPSLSVWLVLPLVNSNSGTEYEAGDELDVIDTTRKHGKVEPEDQLNIFAPTTAALPLSAAIISGVRPDWSAASTGASWDSSSFTQSTWPENAAAWNGVLQRERAETHDQVCIRFVISIQLLHWLQITWNSLTWTLTPIHASYLPLASLQLVMSDPMASNSSDAQFSWSFIL